MAPTQCSSPRASAGFSMLEASIAPSALPAPTRVCSSSMNRMISPSAAAISCSTAFSRSSNSPRILGAGDQRAEVERQQALVVQALRHVAVDDAQRQALDDGGLADAGLADQHGVVLGAARQHLDRAADLLVAADDRVELAFARRLGQVAGIFLERVIALLGGRAVGLAALADLLDRAVQAWGVTPAAASVSAAGVPLARASASSRRSTVTKLSPAFLAICSACRRPAPSPAPYRPGRRRCPRPWAAWRARARRRPALAAGSPPAARIRLARGLRCRPAGPSADAPA